MLPRPARSRFLAGRISAPERGRVPSTEDPLADDAHIRSAESKLAALRAGYAAGLREKLRAIQERLDAGDPAEAKALAHKVRGTAGSYGYAHVGEAAGRLEDALELGEANVGELARALAALADGLDVPEPDADEEEGGPVVLVLEPDDQVRRRCLESTPPGPRVRFVSDPMEALEAAMDGEVVGAVLPAGGGARGGYAVARSLRTLEGLARLPIAFTGVEESVEARVKAVHAGGRVVFAEGVGPSVLRAVGEVFSEPDGDAPTVLLVDDDPDMGEVVRPIVERRGWQFAHLLDPGDIFNALATHHPDAVLLDVRMGAIGGFDVCRALRASAPHRDLPILFLTANASEEVRVACFEAGGDDYLQKPVLPTELLARLEVRIERLRLLRDRARRDSLTGLAMRGAAYERIEAAMAQAVRHGRPLALGLLDLDRFKQINDELGHVVGDRVLSAVGALLRDALRPHDVAGRWGGEEIIVALPDTGAGEGKRAFERLLGAVRALDIPGVSDREVTFSGGVAYLSVDGDDLRTLLNRADARLYAAKAAGRARVVDAEADEVKTP